MATKDPTDLTVEKKLETLYQLQTTLSQIDEKRALRGELPLEVQDLEDEIAGLATRIEKIEAEIAEFRAAITQKKGDIADAENIVARYKEQLNDARNNREYDMLSKEIVFQELEIELCNKKIKEALVKIEEREGSLQQNKSIYIRMWRSESWDWRIFLVMIASIVCLVHTVSTFPPSLYIIINVRTKGDCRLG